MENMYSILRGVVDMHIHTAPDVFERRVNDIEAVRQAKEVGMRAVLLKCHQTLTADRAWLVAKMEPGIEVFGALCLDIASCGGINVEAVKVAIKLGAKEIWMPTIDAANHLKYYGGNLENAVEVFSKNESLKPEMEQILKLIAESNVILGTGHLSPRETEILVDEAKKIGVKKILVTHPEFEAIKMPVETQKKLVKKGALMEYCFFSVVHLGFLGRRTLISPAELASQIREVGAENCVMSTDFGNIFLPPPIEGMRMYISSMRAQGISQREIDIMVKENPSKLLDIK